MEDTQKKELLNAFLENPTLYAIQIVDNSMLPAPLTDKKELEFTIKAPSLEVLAKCALPMLRIPESIRESEKLKLEDALKYRNEMAECLSILAHGKSSDPPEWYIPFFLKNLTAKELYMLFYESIMKLQTDFFLNSFQIANQNNPMMMNQKKNR